MLGIGGRRRPAGKVRTAWRILGLVSLLGGGGGGLGLGLSGGSSAPARVPAVVVSCDPDSLAGCEKPGDPGLAPAGDDGTGTDDGTGGLVPACSADPSCAGLGQTGP